MSRAITSQEAYVVEWLLDHAAVGDVAEYRNSPMRELQVLPGCTCGCSSLDFQPAAWGGATIIADAFAIYPDGQRAGLSLRGRAGAIALLELYDCGPDASHRFPEVSDLRSFG